AGFSPAYRPDTKSVSFLSQNPPTSATLHLGRIIRSGEPGTFLGWKFCFQAAPVTMKGQETPVRNRAPQPYQANRPCGPIIVGPCRGVFQNPTRCYRSQPVCARCGFSLLELIV